MPLLKCRLGMLLLDDNGEIQWINPYLQKYFERKELLGFKLEIVDPD